MDFLQTIFNINIFLLRILEIYMAKKQTPEFDVTYVPIVMNRKWVKKTPDFHEKYVPIVMNQKWGKKLQIFTQNMSL